MPKKIGILLTNTGTPDAPTPAAIRRYLREFLSDKRIVQLPRFIWFPILYGLILPIRPYLSAKLYQCIWSIHGSPMRINMQKIQTKLAEKIKMPVEIGMNYGNPSIQASLVRLQNHHVEEIIVLPLYPQYSKTTTASSLDRIKKGLKRLSKLPRILINDNYADHSPYIEALANSILRTTNETYASAHLLISFHGIPERFIKKGDPYQAQCELTARLLAKKLKLADNQWTLCYQSRFGYDKWLQPAIFNLLTSLPKQGINRVNVICPGFSVDCLETLEEIAIRGKEIFLAAGGESFQYIPALNDDDDHIEALTTIINHLVFTRGDLYEK